jgi:hypothetical protein
MVGFPTAVIWIGPSFSSGSIKKALETRQVQMSSCGSIPTRRRPKSSSSALLHGNAECLGRLNSLGLAAVASSRAWVLSDRDYIPKDGPRGAGFYVHIVNFVW